MLTSYIYIHIYIYIYIYIYDSYVRDDRYHDVELKAMCYKWSLQQMQCMRYL